MATTPMTVADLVRRVPLFASLSDAQGQHIAECAVKRSYGRHELIVEQGKRHGALYILLSGRALVVSADTRQREVVLSILGPGDYVGEMSLIDGQTHSASVRCAAPSDVLIIEASRFAQCLPEARGLAFAVLRGLVQRLRNADHQIESLAFLDVRGRVVRALLDLSEIVDDQRLVRRRPTRLELGKMVGASREMVGRVMTDLASRGLITLNPGGLVTLHGTWQV